MTQATVELCDVMKRFHKPSPWPWKRGGAPATVLDGLDLALEPGGRLALLGSNGAGKTTVLKLVAGLLIPDSGSVHVNGLRVRDGRHMADEGVSFVIPDERSFHWRLTVDENLEFFGWLNGIRGVALRQRIDSLLDRLDLLQYRSSRVGGLSSGTKQRLALVRGLLIRPRILLLDEPTRSIDPSHSAEVWQVVQAELDDCGASAILVTHNTAEALALAGRVAILSGGRVALESTTGDLRQAANGLHGFTLTVSGLRGDTLQQLECLPGVARMEVLSQVGPEKNLGVTMADDGRSIGPLLATLTAEGAAVTSFQAVMPVETALERLLAEQREPVAPVPARGHRTRDRVAS